MKLILGNKNYSSWSLRPWLLLKQLGIAFEEEVISLDDPQFKPRLTELTGVARVPVLIDGDRVIWDSLAITEYVAEKAPNSGVWPVDEEARSVARSVVCEMHSSFFQIRGRMPMNVRASLPKMGWNVDVQREIDRVEKIWAQSRERFGQGGPFLFGKFCAADAFYAPVVFRFVTHAVSLSAESSAYVETLLKLPAMREWAEAGKRESWALEASEIYRAPSEG